MQYINLNLTETNTNYKDDFSLTDMALGTESPEQTQATYDQNGGGDFFGLFGSNKNDVNKVVLVAAKEKNWAVVEWLVKNNVVTKFDVKDSDGNTLLHYLVTERKDKNVHDIVKKILNSSNIKLFINVTNNEGDTALHRAVKAGNHDVATMLIDRGAKKDIKNKEGQYVDTETEVPEEREHVEYVEHDVPQTSTGINVAELERVAREAVNKIFNRFKEQPVEVETESSLGFKNAETEQPSKQDRTYVETTEDFLRDLKNKYNREESNTHVSLSGGGDTGVDSDADTERFLNNLINKYLKQDGGKSIVGQRSVRKLSDYGYEDDKRQTELAKMIGGQANEIHKDVLKTIMDVMCVDEETARNYKAYLWNRVKREEEKIIADGGEKLSNLDKAVKLQELTQNKDSLKKMLSKSGVLEEAKTLREDSRRKSEERRKNKFSNSEECSDVKEKKEKKNKLESSSTKSKKKKTTETTESSYGNRSSYRKYKNRHLDDSEEISPTSDEPVPDDDMMSATSLDIDSNI